MITLQRFGAAVLVASLTAGAALAQDAMPAAPMTSPAPETAAPNADSTAVNTGAVASTAMPPDQTAGATSTNVTVTNGPVPDTRANRARYGSPMSHAGKRTAPAGN